MKKNHPLSLYNSDNPPDQPKQESPSQSRSPYLKSIFSGSARPISPGKNLPVTNPDYAAALRYIKESASIRKIYIGKISC